MTTETQMLIYQHENTHPLATRSLVYQELAKRAKELEGELAKRRQPKKDNPFTRFEQALEPTSNQP